MVFLAKMMPPNLFNPHPALSTWNFPQFFLNLFYAQGYGFIVQIFRLQINDGVL